MNSFFDWNIGTFPLYNYLVSLSKQESNRDVIWQRKVAIGNESLPSSLPSLIAKSRWLRGKVTFQGKIFSFLIKLLWIISILYLYYCCTIYKLLFGIKGTQISHAFHDFCWLHLNFPIIMEHEPFTSSLPLFDKSGQWMPLFVAQITKKPPKNLVKNYVVSR